MEFKTQGNLLYQQGKREAAIKQYTAGVDFVEGSGSTSVTAEDKGCLHLLYSNRSLAQLELYQVDEALQDAELCIEAAPEFAKGFARRAAVLIQLFKYDAALCDLAKAEALDPQFKCGEDKLIASGKKWVPNCYLRQQQEKQKQHSSEASNYVLIDDESKEEIRIVVDKPYIFESDWEEAYRTGNPRLVQRVLDHVLRTAEYFLKVAGNYPQNKVKEQFKREFGPNSLDIREEVDDSPGIPSSFSKKESGGGWTNRQHQGEADTFVNFEMCRFKILMSRGAVDAPTLEWLNETINMYPFPEKSRQYFRGGPMELGPCEDEPRFFVAARDLVVVILAHVYVFFGQGNARRVPQAMRALGQLNEILSFAVETLGVPDPEVEGALHRNGARHYYPILCMLRFWLPMPEGKERTFADFHRWEKSIQMAKVANETFGPSNSPKTGVAMVAAVENCFDILVSHCNFLQADPKRWKPYYDGSKDAETITMPPSSNHELDSMPEAFVFEALGKDLLRANMRRPDEVLEVLTCFAESNRKKAV